MPVCPMYIYEQDALDIVYYIHHYIDMDNGSILFLFQFSYSIVRDAY
jgi:hypothetical protein